MCVCVCVGGGWGVGDIKFRFLAQILSKSHFPAYCFPNFPNPIISSSVYLFVIPSPSDLNPIFPVKIGRIPSSHYTLSGPSHYNKIFPTTSKSDFYLISPFNNIALSITSSRMIMKMKKNNQFDYFKAKY